MVKTCLAQPLVSINCAVLLSESDVDIELASPVYGLGVTKLDAPTLLHLGHPYALANLRSLLAHVKSFRQLLGGLSVRGENAQIARNVLVDLVDCSGLNLSSLDSLLAECLRDAQSLSGKLCSFM